MLIPKEIKHILIYLVKNQDLQLKRLKIEFYGTLNCFNGIIICIFDYQKIIKILMEIHE